MFFDLEAADGHWFPFFASRVDAKTGEILYDEPATDGKVKIRSLTPFVEQRIAKRKRAVEHVYNPKTRSMDRLEYSPQPTTEEAQQEREDAWDYAILDWENIKAKGTGELIPCTRENKLRLMRVPVFDRFFARCQELLAEMAVSEEEASQKN